MAEAVTWGSFVRAYADQHNLLYGQALTQAGPAWKAYKEEMGVAKYKRDLKKQRNALAAQEKKNSSVDQEKKKEKKRKLPPVKEKKSHNKRKRQYSSEEEEDSSEEEEIPKKKKKRKSPGLNEAQGKIVHQFIETLNRGNSTDHKNRKSEHAMNTDESDSSEESDSDA